MHQFGRSPLNYRISFVDISSLFRTQAFSPFISSLYSNILMNLMCRRRRFIYALTTIYGNISNMSSAHATCPSFGLEKRLNELFTIIKLLKRNLSLRLGVGNFSSFYSSFIAFYHIGIFVSFICSIGIPKSQGVTHSASASCLF